MKKLFAILMTVAMLASMTAIASAENVTTLTTSVPAATYKLNIPADKNIDFGATSTTIGNVTVTDAQGFAPGKNLEVTVTYTDFSCDGVNTTIPFSISGRYDWTYNSSGPSYHTINSGDKLLFECVGTNILDRPDHPVSTSLSLEQLSIVVTSDNWGKALAGNYTATITFTAEVVAD